MTLWGTCSCSKKDRACGNNKTGTTPSLLCLGSHTFHTRKHNIDVKGNLDTHARTLPYIRRKNSTYICPGPAYIDASSCSENRITRLMQSPPISITIPSGKSDKTRIAQIPLPLLQLNDLSRSYRDNTIRILSPWQ
jgi:hypothetical protein